VANGNGVTSARLVPIARDLELNEVTHMTGKILANFS
jgi:hypothetical protein